MRFETPNRLIRSILVASAIALVGAAPALAQSSLSLAEAQRLAVERSRGLASQRLAVDAAREMAVAAGQYPDPILSLSVENVPAQGADRFSLTRDFMTMKRVGVMQELTGREKRALRAERYDIEGRKALAEQAAVLASVQRDTALAWLDTWYAERVVGAIAELRERALQEVQAAESEYRAGKGSQPEVLMAHTNVAMLDDRAAEALRKARNARAVLARWAGDGAATRTLGPVPDIGTHGMSAHDEILAGHPEIETLARAQEVAAAEARLARANRTPDWSIELAYQELASRFGDMFTVGVSIPLPWDRANRQDRELAAKLAMAEQAQAMREEALRKHVAEVRTMLNEWESNRSRIARYEREIVPLAKARFEAAATAYRGGKSSRSEVLAALRAELDARLMALMLESETARLWAQLTYLIPENVK